MATYEQPSCPHCSYEFEDDELWHDGGGCKFPKNKDQTEEFECPRCGAKLLVTYDPMPHWNFEDIEDEDD